MFKSLQRILVTLAVVIALPAAAQNDPPARVGRLAFIENEVNFRVDRSDQGGPATLNWPVSSGAVLETGRRGRAEVWVGSTAYRLADDSQLEFAAVDDARVDVRLNEGSLAVSVLDRDQADDVMVVTPDGNVRFLTPGRYRIDVFADHSELSVQAGRATFDDGQRVTPVAAGQQFSRSSDGNERLDANRDHDAFDQWVASRENATLAGTARRHVSPHMTGYQDLDAYGDWQTAPDYGSVWYPRAVADDWAPYRYGRWAWVAPWGWTWIDQAPWGFAPFHYGRWAIVHGRWGWMPGRLVSRPVYAPALVGWIGNPGWSVGFSFGAAPAVGWFPLGPREVYVPGHRHSNHYVRQINVTHVRDVAIIDRATRPGGHAPFMHHGTPRAVTVVPANLVREGRPITAREIRRQERPELGRAPLARHAPNADWLAPAPGAARSHSEERREQMNRQPRRDFDAARQNGQERSAPRSEPMQRNPDRPAFRQPVPEAGNVREAEPRREIMRRSPENRPEVENRGRPVDAVPAPVPMRREAPTPEQRQAGPDAGRNQPLEQRRDGLRGSPERRPEIEKRDRPVDVAPAPVPQRREAPTPELRQAVPDASRNQPVEQRREIFRQPAESRPEPQMRPRPADVTPAPAPVRREMPVPEMRNEERQPRPMMQPQEREQRREVREIQREVPREVQREAPRMERPVPRETEAPQMMRQREMPRPAPEIRAPAPPPVQEFRAPPPASVPMPQPRVEPPSQPAPQGGAQPEKRRRQGDEDDRRGR